MEKIIRKFYPHALKATDFVKQKYEAFRNEYHINPGQVLVARSICSDDINSMQYPQAIKLTLGPFNLGGLGGYPFGGLTGMGAFAHHVPENGAAAIFYAPHIGIGASKEPGLILRPGQQQASSCCGAVVQALNQLEKNEIRPKSYRRYDHQQHILEMILLNNADRIKKAQNRLIEAVDVIYEASGEMVNHLISVTHFTGRYLFVIGAVMINDDLQSESFVEPRRFECYNLRSREFTANLKHFRRGSWGSL